jgi:hypothetical protein
MRIAGVDLLAAHIWAGRSIQVAAELAGMTRRQAQTVMGQPNFPIVLAESRRLLRDKLMTRLADELVGTAAATAVLEGVAHAS